MRLLMPSHVNSVQLYRDTAPVFAKAGVESQLDAMFSNQVTLKSGGYIVFNQTEALVAIDVNSGRSTREHNIEDTALRTNLEAADEIARQLRLRDLAGLIVVDFIDMEESRNNRAVERRIKDALKNDRARIQVGRISHFGLLEMSRQRIRTGVLEGSTVICPHCQGAGVVRSTASIALHVLRVLEDALIKSSTHDLIVRTRTPVALYILNQKRLNLRDLERRFGVAIVVEADDTLTGANYHAIERGELATGVKSEPETRSRWPTTSRRSSRSQRRYEERRRAWRAEASAESMAPVEDSEVGRRRRRRRRRRGERPFGDNLRRMPHNRRMTAWRSSPKSAAISLHRAVTVTLSTEEVRAAEKNVIVDREVRAARRNRFRQTDGEGSLRPPPRASIRPRRWRLRKSSPRLKRTIPPPPPEDASLLTTRRWPATRVAAARDPRCRSRRAQRASTASIAESSALGKPMRPRRRGGIRSVGGRTAATAT